VPAARRRIARGNTARQSRTPKARSFSAAGGAGRTDKGAATLRNVEATDVSTLREDGTGLADGNSTKFRHPLCFVAALITAAAPGRTPLGESALFDRHCQTIVAELTKSLCLRRSRCSASALQLSASCGSARRAELHAQFARQDAGRTAGVLLSGFPEADRREWPA